MMPDEPTFQRLTDDLIRNTLADRRFNPVEDERLKKMQDEYNKTRKRIRDLQKGAGYAGLTSDIFIPTTTSSGPHGSDHYGRVMPTQDDFICLRCGQDKRYVYNCDPSRHPDHAKRLRFDSDTVVDGEVVEERRELE